MDESKARELGVGTTSTSSHVFHRSFEKSYPTAQTGKGVYIHTSDGRRILDGSSGAAVSSVGHGNREVIEAICQQATQLAFAHSSFFTSDPAELLAKTITENSDGEFQSVMFLSSGSEAVESALKLARQYHVFNGQPERVNFVGRQHSYHGNTLGALGAGYNPARRSVFEPILADTFRHVRPCFFERDGKGKSEIQYEDELLADYEAAFTKIGTGSIAAVIIEPIVGATLGSVLPTKTYLQRLHDMCRRYGILLIYDEVMCGMARCGGYHAWQRLNGPAPDLQTIGKGLAGGYQPLSAVLVGERVHNIFQQQSKGPKTFMSGHTYQDHSIACAAGLATQRIIVRDKLAKNALRMGSLLHELLEKKLPPAFKMNGGSVRGSGLFKTIDFGPPSGSSRKTLAKAMASTTFDLGVATYLCSPLVDAILVCPPLCIEEHDVQHIAETVVKAYDLSLLQMDAE